MTETDDGAFCAMEFETCTAGDAHSASEKKNGVDPEGAALNDVFWRFAEECRKRVDAWPRWKKAATEAASRIPYWDTEEQRWYWPERRRSPWLN